MKKLDLSEIDENIILYDGFEDALIGYAERYGSPAVAAYDRDKCIEILMTRDSMSYEDAEEYFGFNVIGGWVGEYTPIFVTLHKGYEEKNCEG